MYGGLKGGDVDVKWINGPLLNKWEDIKAQSFDCLRQTVHGRVTQLQNSVHFYFSGHITVHGGDAVFVCTTQSLEISNEMFKVIDHNYATSRYKDIGCL